MSTFFMYPAFVTLAKQPLRRTLVLQFYMQLFLLAIKGMKTKSFNKKTGTFLLYLILIAFDNELQ